MPEEPWVWAVAIIAGAIVVIVALMLGGRVEVSLDPVQLKFRRRGESRRGSVSVLESAEIENAEIGAVAGVRHSGNSDTSAASANSTVEVGKGARISGGSVEEITGVEIDGRPKTER